MHFDTAEDWVRIYSAAGLTDLDTETGPFDILFEHANFFSLLVPCEVKVNTGFEAITIKIDGGILHVRDNQLTLFANV